MFARSKEMKTKSLFLAGGLVVKANLIASEIIQIKEVPEYLIDIDWDNQKPNFNVAWKRD